MSGCIILHAYVEEERSVKVGMVTFQDARGRNSEKETKKKPRISGEREGEVREGESEGRDAVVRRVVEESKGVRSVSAAHRP